MTSEWRVVAALASLVAVLAFLSQDPTYASTIKIPAIGVNAPIVSVPVRHGNLLIGKSPHVAYTARHGDPPCDSSGDTVYAFHAWRAGNGVGDHLASLKRGNIIRLPGCRFKVVKRRLLPGNRAMRHLGRPSGPAKITLISCKADNYTIRVLITARLITKDPLKGGVTRR